VSHGWLLQLLLQLPWLLQLLLLPALADGAAVGIAGSGRQRKS